MRRLYSTDREWTRSRFLQRVELFIRSCLAHGEQTATDTHIRPSIPPVLLCSLICWGSCAALYTLFREVLDGLAFGFLVVGVVFGVAFLALGIKTGRLVLMSVLLGLAIGTSSAANGAYVQRCLLDTVNDGSIDVKVLELLDDAREPTFSRFATAYAYDEAGHRYKVRVYLDAEESILRYGQVLSVTGTIAPDSEQSAQSSWTNGIVGTVTPKKITPGSRSDLLGGVIDIRNVAIDAICGLGGSEEVRAVLCALVCGYRVDLYDSDAYTDFKIAGLAHLVAVSGSHLSLVTMLLGSILSTFRVSKVRKTLLQVALVFGYLVFTGMPISAIRAALMASASLVAFTVRRRASSLNALGVCLLAFIAFEPQSAVSTSLALSATSVLGILVFTKLFLGWTSDFKIPALRKIGESVATTMAASILSAPLSACLFNQLPIISPIANLVAAPLFTAVCMFGVLASFLAVIVPPVGTLLLGLALAMCEVMCATIHLVSSLPFASVPFVGNVPISIVATAVAATLLWRWWPRLSVAAVSILVAFLVATSLVCYSVGSTQAGLQLVALDVGQGDAILVRDGGNAILIDTGKEDQKLLAALARAGIVHLDAVILTHADADHVRSLGALTGIVQVDCVIIHRDAFSCPCSNCADMVANAKKLVGDDSVKGVSEGDSITLGRVEFSVIWPYRYVDEGGNCDSLCLFADFDADGDGSCDARALLCGDAEDTQLDEMLKRGVLSSVDIYKVGHHGSRKAIDDDTARKLSPKISLVSVGAYNSYGHPATSTLESLRLAGSKVYRTDESGDIMCSIGVQSVSVSP